MFSTYWGHFPIKGSEHVEIELNKRIWIAWTCKTYIFWILETISKIKVLTCMWTNWAGLSSPFRESPKVPTNYFPNENTICGLLKLEYLFAWHVLMREHRVIYILGRVCDLLIMSTPTSCGNPKRPRGYIKPSAASFSLSPINSTPKSSKNTQRLLRNHSGHPPMPPP
jgi:hypothetical protein